REAGRCGLQDRVGPLELGVLPPQPLQLRRLLSRHPGPLTGVDLGLAAPLPDSLRRPDTEQLGDLAHRSPLRLVIGPDLGDHPDRPLTQLGRVPPRRTPWHDSILPKERSLRTCRGGSPEPEPESESEPQPAADSSPGSVFATPAGTTDTD